jgi:hypothetical protein
MAEKGQADSTRLPVTLPKAPPPNSHNETGVIKTVGDSQIPREFITPGWDVESAVVLGRIPDVNTLNDFTRLRHWGQKHKVRQVDVDMTFYFNGTRAIQGMGSVFGIMAHSQIISPEALGIPLHKKSSEDIENQSRERKRQRQDEEQHRG